MNLSDTDQAPYSAPAPQTATVSDEAVQAALDKWFGADHYEYKNACFDAMRLTLIAAAPHLSLSAAPCSVEVKKLPCDVQLPGAIFKRGVSISTLIAALERREHWPDVLTHLPAKPVDVAAELPDVEEGISLAISLLFAHEEKYHDYEGDNVEGDNVEGDSLRGIRHHLQGCLIHADELRDLSPAEPVEQYSSADELRDLQQSILQSKTLADFNSVKKTVERLAAPTSEGGE